MTTSQVVVITGGARGQGAAEARAFVREGARVVIGDVLDDEGERLVAELGSVALYVHLDVTCETLWAEAINRTEAAFGPLTTLINNAGIIHSAPVHEETVDSFRRVIDVNLYGTFLGIRAAIPSLTRAGGGSIVNISSMAGMRGGASTPAYTSSKWAIRGLSKTAAIELAPRGIRVNTVFPGVIETTMLANSGRTPKQFLERWQSRLLVPRLGTVDDVAELIVFLTSEEASYVTGSEFVVDGGLLAAS